jgi:hypothetical protein
VRGGNKVSESKGGVRQGSEEANRARTESGVEASKNDSALLCSDQERGDKSNNQKERSKRDVHSRKTKR